MQRKPQIWRQFIPEPLHKPETPLAESGLLLIDKPAGISSMDVIRILRLLSGTRKIGHAGTLDPFATGLLPILVNKATRWSEKIMADSKQYSGEFRLGASSSTQDLTGEISEHGVQANASLAELNRLAASLTGEIEQIPPVYSAKKINGRALYQYARAGETVEIKSRQVRVDAFQIEAGPAADLFHYFVHCGKGVYVRTLVHDLGQLQGSGAYVTSLRRLAVGRMTIAMATPLSALADQESIRQKLISLPDLEKLL